MKDTTMTAQTADDKRKIEAYRKTLGKYPKPSLTADIVAVRPAYGELLLEVCEGEWEDLGGRAHAPAKLYRRRIIS